MRYKDGITQQHMRDPKLFVEVMSSRFPKKQEQFLSMLNLERVDCFIEFTNRKKDFCVSSYMTMPLSDNVGENAFPVWDFDGMFKGEFDFKHVEVRNEQSSVYFV